MSQPVLSPAELESVRAFLAERAEVVGGLDASLVSGGRSNLTVRLRDEAASDWILRMPPRAGRTPSAHDMAREFKVVAALGGTDVPVPPAVGLWEGSPVLDCDYAITEFVPGAALSSRADLDALDDAELGRVTDGLLAALAALHRVDHVAVGLEGFGRTDGFAARQLRRWGGQWELVAPDDDATRALAAELVERLGDGIPEQRTHAIIHGDFRVDNALVDPAAASPVAAVVDWELSTIGDPVADVATMCAYRHEAFDLVLGRPAAWTSPRLPGAEELAEGYLAAGGAPLEEWDFHLSLAHFKIAVIAAGIAHRHRSAGGDPASDSAAQAVAPYLEAGLESFARR